MKSVIQDVVRDSSLWEVSLTRTLWGTCRMLWRILRLLNQAGTGLHLSVNVVKKFKQLRFAWTTAADITLMLVKGRDSFETIYDVGKNNIHQQFAHNRSEGDGMAVGWNDDRRFGGLEWSAPSPNPQWVLKQSANFFFLNIVSVVYHSWISIIDTSWH